MDPEIWCNVVVGWMMGWMDDSGERMDKEEAQIITGPKLSSPKSALLSVALSHSMLKLQWAAQPRAAVGCLREIQLS